MGMIVNPSRFGAGAPAPGLSFSSDIIYWWDSEVNLVATGSTFTSWTDKVAGSGMTQYGFGGNYSAGIGTKSCVYLRGYAPVSLSGATYTFLSIQRFDSSGSLNWGRLLSVNNSAAPGDENQAGGFGVVRYSNTSQLTIYRDSATVTPAAIGYNTPVVVAVVLNGTNTQLLLNNVSLGTVAKNAALNANQLGVGYECAASGIEHLAAGTGDVIVVNRALNSTELTEAYNFLRTKYGL